MAPHREKRVAVSGAPVDKHLTKRLFEFLGQALKAENTPAGRTNLVAMVLALVAVIALSLAPVIELIVRLFRPEAEVGTPVLQILALFFCFMMACVVMVMFLGERHR